MAGRRRHIESSFFAVCRSCSHVFILMLWITQFIYLPGRNVISQRLNRRDYIADMTYISQRVPSASRKKILICRSCSQIKNNDRHDLHLRARRAFSWAPRAAAQRLKNNDYMADMTYIYAPGPGLVCHHVLKYPARMTNTRARPAAYLGAACCLPGSRLTLWATKVYPKCLKIRQPPPRAGGDGHVSV